MAERKSRKFPYRPLGFQLRNLREKHKESVADVSGAVEIDIELLTNIEEGVKLPDEDILLLLISHFGLKNEEAMKLWRMAGYDNMVETTPQAGSDNLSQQAAVFILPIDSRIIYSDNVEVDTNNNGIVLNFKQNNLSQKDQPLIVARVGMSKENAEKIYKKIEKALKAKKAKE